MRPGCYPAAPNRSAGGPLGSAIGAASAGGAFGSAGASTAAGDVLGTGSTAFAAGEFGKGRVFCFSPHPEKTPGLEVFLDRAIAWTLEAKQAAL